MGKIAMEEKSSGINYDFYSKLEPKSMTKDKQITILRKYVALLQEYLKSARLSELLAVNELRAMKGLPKLSLEVPDEEWIFTGDDK